MQNIPEKPVEVKITNNFHDIMVSFIKHMYTWYCKSCIKLGIKKRV